MICHIGNGCLITYAEINNTNCILLRQFIGNRYLKFSRKSILTIRTDSGKSNGILLLLNRGLPQFLLKSIRTTVKVILAFIRCQLHFLTIDHKSGVCNTVSASADARSKKAAVYEITLKIIITKDNICQSAFLVRYTDLHQDRTIL